MGFLDRLKKKDMTPERSKLMPGIGRIPYPAYRGKEPYIFISYAHADAPRVFKEIAWLNESGYHVWYDEGISPGNEWTDEIAAALAKCAVFIVMITPISAPRVNVLNEINYALDDGKPFLAIHLEKTTLQGGLRLRTGTKQAILKYNMTGEEYRYKLVEALDRFGLKRKTEGRDFPPVSDPPVSSRQEESGAAVDAAAVEAEPGRRETAPMASGNTLSPEARLRIERTMNSNVRDVDFEWIGSTLKGFHGIQKNVVIPMRATRIMSHAFSGLPMESIVLHEGITALDFAAFNKCASLKEAVIESPQIRINNIDQIGAFYQCPNVVVYCHRDTPAHEELKRTHDGEIRFIEGSD